MPVPTAITDLSTTAASNSPGGSENVFPDLDNYVRAAYAFIAQQYQQGLMPAQIDLASASTTDIGGQTTPNLNITGTTTITSFGTNYKGARFLRFDGALTLTHNATTLILPGATNITTAAGDTCIAVPNSSTSGTADGWLVMAYQRASVNPIDVASASTVDLGLQASQSIRITGTTTITSFGTNYRGPVFIRFGGALTLTHNATTLILPGAANITTAAGDTCIAVPVASSSGTANGWMVMAYQRAALPPAYAVNRSTTQSLADSTFTEVVTNQETFDTASAHNTSTGRFTPQVAGYYQINAVIGTSQTTGVLSVGLRKNGSQVAATLVSASSAGCSGTVSGIVFLNGSTDYVSIFAWQNSGGSVNIASGDGCYVSGSLVRYA